MSELYDKEIAPRLLELAKMCEQHKIPCVFVVRDGEEIGETIYMGSAPGVEMRLIAMATKARGNFDALTLAVRKYAETNGHNSVVLKLLEREPKS